MILWVRGIGTLQQVVSTITTTESARPQLNNPGNLIYVGQAGASPSSYTFVGTDGRTYALAQFSTPDAGEAALENQIQIDANQGMTIQQFANSYAPAGNGNNPTAYAQYIANAAGVGVNDPLSTAITTTPAATVDTGMDEGAGDILDVSDDGTGISTDASVLGMDPGTFAATAGVSLLALWFMLR
jgi:hypothetical protein